LRLLRHLRSVLADGASRAGVRPDGLPVEKSESSHSISPIDLSPCAVTEGKMTVRYMLVHLIIRYWMNLLGLR